MEPRAPISGFAVVANEVRILAQRSADTASRAARAVPQRSEPSSYRQLPRVPGNQGLQPRYAADEWGEF